MDANLLSVANNETVREPSHDTIAKYVRRWGNSSAIALLDPACSIFWQPGIEGFIGYRVEYGCAIAFGDPVCEEENKPSLATAFCDHCKTNKLRLVFVTTTETFSDWAKRHICHSLLQIGDDLIMDPQSDPKAGSKGRILRKKENHSTQEGVTVTEYTDQNPELEKKLEEVGFSWLKARHGPQIFLTHMHLFSDRKGKRWFYATHKNEVVGVLALDQIAGKNGWLVNLLMPTKTAPNGTSELMVLRAIETLRQEGCTYLSFGVTPSSELGETEGLSKGLVWFLKYVFKAVKYCFGLNNRRQYWEKFQPHYEHSYVLFVGKSIGIREVLAILRSLNTTVY